MNLVKEAVRNFNSKRGLAIRLPDNEKTKAKLPTAAELKKIADAITQRTGIAVSIGEDPRGRGVYIMPPEISSKFAELVLPEPGSDGDS